MVEVVIHVETSYRRPGPVPGCRCDQCGIPETAPSGSHHSEVLYVRLHFPEHLPFNYANIMHRAFSTVVADNQFSTLGIVLMAALARLSKVTGISREMKMQVAPGKTTKKASPVTMTEDLGERVCREDDALMTRPVHASRPVDKKSASKEKPEKDRSSSKSVKKTKKKKNAIDDLFSGLF
jgi:ribonuclease MRP protein subunit RMP1